MKTKAIETQAVIQRPILRFNEHQGFRNQLDCLVVEEPLEIRLNDKTITITMRTPGDDFALAVGFLLCEGVIQSADDIDSIRYCGMKAHGQTTSNIVRIRLNANVKVAALRLDRHFYASSSCGVCGKASLEALAVNAEPFETNDLPFDPAMISELPSRLSKSQLLFHQTGGIHASGLFDDKGVLLDMREDIGRHNAVDKIIGHRVLSGHRFSSSEILCISGRASFEILQKAITARIPTIVAVGAPSSLAIDLANRFNMTLIGFANAKRFNVYAGQNRFLSTH